MIKDGGVLGARCNVNPAPGSAPDDLSRCAVPTCSADTCLARQAEREATEAKTKCACSTPGEEVLVPCVETSRPFGDVGGSDALCGNYAEVTVDSYDDTANVCETLPCGANEATCLLADNVTVGTGVDATGRCSLRAALRLLGAFSSGGQLNATKGGGGGGGGPVGRRRRELLQTMWQGAPMRIFLPGKYTLDRAIELSEDNPVEIVGTTETSVGPRRMHARDCPLSFATNAFYVLFPFFLLSK